ncbi:MAG: TIM barrel protein [Candidatus Aenigmarchaeota archaeon]|nr:TIM barrel protein [Candidatus Aenigmarchaeota archaeon]
MRVFLGPAGLPMASEGNTVDGIRKIKELGLNAMEIEFVRSIYLNEKTAEEVGKAAKELGIRLSIHAPYFINLLSKNRDVAEKSKERIIKSAVIGEILGADAIAIHTAYYSGLTKEVALTELKEIFIKILDELNERGVKNVKLGVETMGRKSMFGGLDETIELCKDVNRKQLVPYLDFGHLFVRNNGKINYSEIFDKMEPLKLDHINSQFAGMGKNKRGEFVDVHTPIGNYPPFEPLAKEILKRKLDITIISESPLLEIDSLKMKSVFDRLT